MTGKARRAALPSTGSERRAEIRGLAKQHSLLEGQEAVLH